MRRRCPSRRRLRPWATPPHAGTSETRRARAWRTGADGAAGGRRRRPGPPSVMRSTAGTARASAACGGSAGLAAAASAAVVVATDAPVPVGSALVGAGLAGGRGGRRRSRAASRRPSPAAPRSASLRLAGGCTPLLSGDAGSVVAGGGARRRYSSRRARRCGWPERWGSATCAWRPEPPRRCSAVAGAARVRVDRGRWRSGCAALRRRVAGPLRWRARPPVGNRADRCRSRHRWRVAWLVAVVAS